MRIYLKMKTPGKRRPILDDIPYEIPDNTATLRELLTALVQAEVERYNGKPRSSPSDEAPPGLDSPSDEAPPGLDSPSDEAPPGLDSPSVEALSAPDHAEKTGRPELPGASESGLLSFLSPDALQEQAGTGKVSFGRVYSAKKADPDKAVENALQCFRDGLVRVFREEQEITGLEEPLGVQPQDHFTLIRLTFLAGSLW